MGPADTVANVYVEEVRELLGELEQALLALEEQPSDAERVDACFRAMHTIKGGGAMFGYDEITRFTHDVETVFDRIRSGGLAVTSELLTLSLRARDHILALIEAPPGTVDPALVAASDELLKEFCAIQSSDDSGDSDASEAPAVERGTPAADERLETESGTSTIYWARFLPQPEILRTGAQPLHLLEDLVGAGVARVRRLGRIPLLRDPEFDPELFYGGFEILLVSRSSVEELLDIFVFVEGDSEISIVPLAEGAMRGADLDELMDELEKREDEPADLVREFLRERVDAKLRSIATAKAAAALAKARPAAKSPQPEASTLRVESAKLDRLVTMVGELVILQSRLRQSIQANDNASAALVDEDLERLTDEMRDLALGLRMLPIGTVFSVFRRLVRDLSMSLSKDVELVTEGGDTELDKTVIDRIKDPLVHLLRNCMDHAMETPEERERLGKPRKGTITLSASHSGGSVVISVSDDGRGIDTDAVRQRAVEKGLIPPDAELTEDEVVALIFKPGFSTAAKISDVSGRGVGMDVVRRNIEELRGTVEVVNRKGLGASMIIRLPLTLAIIDGFSVLVGGESYIVPLASLRGFHERFAPEPARLVDTFERMGEMTPLVSLRRLFDVPGEQPGYERLVIVESEGREFGLAVDQVVGRQQAVIKKLDDAYRHLRWLAGTAINGDGSISLILDVPQLVRRAREVEAARGA